MFNQNEYKRNDDKKIGMLIMVETNRKTAKPSPSDILIKTWFFIVLGRKNSHTLSKRAKIEIMLHNEIKNRIIIRLTGIMRDRMELHNLLK